MRIVKIIAFFVIAICATLHCNAKDYNFEVGQFEKIKINGNVSLVYKCLPDSAGYIRYSAGEGNESLFVFNVKKDGTLKIQLGADNWNNKDLPVIYAYSAALLSIESSSELTVTVESVSPCPSFKVNQIGNGSISVEDIKSNEVSASISTGNGAIYLSGRCEDASFNMVGSGLISADRLAADNVKIKGVGTGSIGCWAVDNLNIKCIGTTKIYYKGNPNIKKIGRR